MTPAAPTAIAITKAVEAVMRKDRGRLLSALVARLRDFQLAEDALQEAVMAALSHWGRSGLPNSPEGWLLRVAFRKALDRLRQSARAGRNAADMALLAEEEACEMTPDAIPDERLRLIFTCCHPALDPKSRVALTLRTIGGLTTPEIARVFLDADTTMGQRLSRAKAKITGAGIPFAVPGPEDWAARLNSVLTVVYLIYTQGHSLGPAVGPSVGASGARDLCAEAVFLARLVDGLRPAEAEVEGCLALLLLTEGRAEARLSAAGQSVALPDQDRSLWSQPMLDEGSTLLDRAMARRQPGPFQIKAAVAALHCAPGTPDWPQIALLYAALYAHEPTPVVRLNHAVALAEAQGPAAGLAEMAPLAQDLAQYQPFHAAMAEYLARSGQPGAARAAYDQAIAMSPSASDAAFLATRRASLPPG